MRIEFTQIYAEPGASFNLPGPLLGAISKGLDDLRKNIEQLSSKFGEGGFELVLIISASSKLDALEIKGPNIRRKASEVEFSFFMPWRETANFAQKVEYVLPMIGEGVCGVLERYGVGSDGVDAVIQGVLREAKTSPDKFQYKKAG
jgi:hypothetical protein